MQRQQSQTIVLASGNCAYESGTRLLKTNFDQPLKRCPVRLGLIQLSVQHCLHLEVKLGLFWQLLGNSRFKADTTDEVNVNRLQVLHLSYILKAIRFLIPGEEWIPLG